MLPDDARRVHRTDTSIPPEFGYECDQNLARYSFLATINTAGPEDRKTNRADTLTAGGKGNGGKSAPHRRDGREHASPET
jgi:hypothetical protein